MNNDLHMSFPQNVIIFQRPGLIIVSLPRQSSLHGSVNAIGYLQDVQIRLKVSCVILQNSEERALPTNVLNYYSVKQFDAFEWGLRRDDEIVSFSEKNGRLELNV